MASRRVAIVTGSNKGIGLAIVRGLCKEFDGDVYLTARDVGRGEAAVKDLMNEGLSPKFHQLDITDHASIQKLHDSLKENYGGIDILVNNAGIAYKVASTATFSEQADVSVRTNYLGTLDACNTLFPLLRSHARVVNVSSLSSQFSLKKLSEERKAAVLGVENIDDITEILAEFVKATKDGDHQEKGWSNSAYGMSKVGVTAMSIVQQAQLDSQGKDDVIVNAVCPGYVSTDMTSYKGHLTVEQGAETPLYAALLPRDTKEPRGRFLREKAPSEWA